MLTSTDVEFVCVVIADFKSGARADYKQHRGTEAECNAVYDSLMATVKLDDHFAQECDLHTVDCYVSPATTFDEFRAADEASRVTRKAAIPWN